MSSANPLFAWQDYYILGLPEIDLQHQHIFEVAARLHAAILAHTERGATVAMLAELHAVLDAHFRTEESMMRERLYVALPQHAAEHAGFLETLAGARDKVAGGAEITSATLRAFNEWVTHHLCGADAVMAANFAQNEVEAK